jgi:hypothetical protein
VLRIRSPVILRDCTREGKLKEVLKKARRIRADDVYTNAAAPTTRRTPSGKWTHPQSGPLCAALAESPDLAAVCGVRCPMCACGA